MDAIDAALTEAWGRIAARVRGDRLEVLRRASRRARIRPHRAWCLALRAADRRLERFAFVPRGYPEAREPHELILTSESIRELCKPVALPWPGIDWTRAAARLGRDPEALRPWIRRGTLSVISATRGATGKRGRPVPFVWSHAPLDPNADHGRAPDPIWGTLWQYLWRRIPDDLEFPVRRVPVTRRDGRTQSPKHRGWLWRCPGLASHASCNRLAARLYFPLRPWTIGEALGLEDPCTPVPPSTPSPYPLAPACRGCHQLRYTSLIDAHGWNEFVTLLSGGLLRGGEVPRPAEVRARRRRAYCARPRTAPRRAQVLHLAREGLSTREIARRLRIRPATVTVHLRRVYKDLNIHCRRELMPGREHARTLSGTVGTAA